VTLRLTWHVVHGEDSVARVVLKQTIVHHAHCATPAFFGGLKNQIHGAIE
jgi:hypothetical protein